MKVLPSVILLATFHGVDCFQSVRQCWQARSLGLLFALTERQMQFWEDVDEGLEDIELFFGKKGQSIDRIRQFAQR